MIMTEITLKDGFKIGTFPRPPAGFDPLAAAPAELEHYGFPPRRGDRRSLERYRRVWGRIKNKYQYIEPTFEIDGNRPPRSRKPTFSQDNLNWSGGIVLAPTDQSFCGVSSEWVVPNIYPPLESQGYWIGSWIGLDGYTGAGANVLLQAGVGQEVYYDGNTLHYDINVWWEWIPGNQVPIAGVPVSPGDLVTVIIWTHGQGSNTAAVYFTNTTSGLSTSVAVSAPPETQLVGNSAEWIVEEPLAYPGLDTLPDYGEVFFSDCEAYTSAGGVVPGPGTGTTVNIVAGTAGSVVSQGALISPGIIQCSYVGPEP
jgi:hypothetical protein